MDGLDGLKQWNCKNDHLLGVIKRVMVDGPEQPYHVSRLMLFREAVDFAEAVKLEEVDVIAVIEGTTLDVRCSVCGATRTWWIGADALERLMNAEGGMQKAESGMRNASTGSARGVGR